MDLISRQAAIDAFYKHPNIDWTTLDVLAKINALPSADVQPHQLTEEDLTELRHRFGNKVERVVWDMISGKEERWMT